MVFVDFRGKLWNEEYIKFDFVRSHSHFFNLWNYTGTIYSNVLNVFKMCSVLFRIGCMSFQLFIRTINMYSYVPVYGTYFFSLVVVYFCNFYHLIDSRILCCARAFIRWMKEMFNAFIHTNITITWFFFLFRCSWGLFLALIIICTQSFFMLICFPLSRSHYVDAFQFLHFHWSNSRLNFFVDMPNFLLTHFFPSTSKLTPLLRIQTCFVLSIILENCLIRNR